MNKKEKAEVNLKEKTWEIIDEHWSDGNGGFKTGSNHTLSIEKVQDMGKEKGLSLSKTLIQRLIYDYIKMVKAAGYVAGGTSWKPTYYEIASDDKYEQLAVIDSRLPNLIGRSKSLNCNVQNASKSLPLPNTQKMVDNFEKTRKQMEKMIEDHNRKKELNPSKDESNEQNDNATTTQTTTAETAHAL